MNIRTGRSAGSKAHGAWCPGSPARFHGAASPFGFRVDCRRCCAPPGRWSGYRMASGPGAAAGRYASRRSPCRSTVRGHWIWTVPGGEHRGVIFRPTKLAVGHALAPIAPGLLGARCRRSMKTLPISVIGANRMPSRLRFDAALSAGSVIAKPSPACVKVL